MEGQPCREGGRRNRLGSPHTWERMAPLPITMAPFVYVRSVVALIRAAICTLLMPLVAWIERNAISTSECFSRLLSVPDLPHTVADDEVPGSVLTSFRLARRSISARRASSVPRAPANWKWRCSIGQLARRPPGRPTRG